MGIKIIAAYLPQYHIFKENEEWWGKGHTEWVSCKSAQKYYKWHNQPRVPYNDNYYDLSTTDEQIHQAIVAKKYGIYGFSYYHYWFNGKKLMERPLENMLHDRRVSIPFCISWANHTWTKSPKKSDRQHVLIEQIYGNEEDWIRHFYYLFQFFKDNRYIRVSGKPMLIIYDSKNIPCWDQMQSTWNRLAKKEGLPGIYYVATIKYDVDINYAASQNFDAQFEYQPTYALSRGNVFNYAGYYNIKRVICRDYLHVPCVINYDKVWRRVLSSNHDGQIKTYLGSYSDWDTTARWGKSGIIHKGASPEKFEYYMSKQIARSIKMNNELMFVTAWNEWSEGAHLEPDEKHGFGYLEAIKRSLLKNEYL